MGTPLKKRILKHPAIEVFLCWLMATLIRTVYYTSSVERLIDEGAKPYAEGKNNGIFAFWHGRMMLIPMFRPASHEMHVLISQHRDGGLIARVMRHFAIDAIRGSSSKGARAAIKEIVRIAGQGDNISITPDGPRGPFQEASKGIVQMAHLTGKPIVPVAFSATRHIRLSSWDRFMIALPFTKVAFAIGAPIHVTSSDVASIEHARGQVQNALSQLTFDVDQRCGVAPC